MTPMGMNDIAFEGKKSGAAVAATLFRILELDTDFAIDHTYKAPEWFLRIVPISDKIKMRDFIHPNRNDEHENSDF